MWFTVLVWRTPTVPRWWFRVSAVVVGVGAGLAGAAKVNSALEWTGPARAYRAPARQAHVLQIVFLNFPTPIAWIWIPSLCVLAVAACTRGTVAIAYGLVIVPTTLAITVLSGRLANSSTWGVPVFVELPLVSTCIATIAALFGAALTMRARHGAVETTMR